MGENQVLQRCLAAVDAEIAREALERLTVSREFGNLHFAAAVKAAQRARSLKIGIYHAGKRITGFSKRLHVRNIFILDVQRDIELAGLLIEVTLVQCGAGGEAELRRAPAQSCAFKRNGGRAIGKIAGQGIPVEPAGFLSRRLLRGRDWS